MARVNVYVPDDLAERARSAGLNVSRIVQEALAEVLAAEQTDRWFEELATGVPRANRPDVSHEMVISAVTEARDELGRT